jgi:hypothetical protein
MYDLLWIGISIIGFFGLLYYIIRSGLKSVIDELNDESEEIKH